MNVMLKTKAQPLTFELYKSEKDFLDVRSLFYSRDHGSSMGTSWHGLHQNA